MTLRTTAAWAILWRSESQAEGRHQALVGVPDHPCHTLLFDTRWEARAYIKKHYGYISRRPDLRGEPFGWKPPRAVRVSIRIEVTA